MAFDVASVNTRRGKADVLNFGAVVTGRQELNRPEDRAEVQRSLPRTLHYVPSAGWAQRLMISWDKDQARAVTTDEWVHLLPADITPTTVDVYGVAWLAHKGFAEVTPGRGIIGTLVELTVGLRCVFLDTHFVSSAHSARRVPFKRWRLRRWNEHKALLDRVVAGLVEAGFLVVLVGDVNYPDPLEVPGLANPRAGEKHPPRGTSAYDQILASPELNIRDFRRADGGNKHNSDHYPRVATLGDRETTVPPRGFMPGAIVKNIPPGSNDPGIVPVGGVVHVAVSEQESLFPFFNGPSGGIESHFYVRRDGTPEQYRSIYFEADANSEGNSFTRDGKRCGLISIETQGMGDGEWTAEQLATIKAIMLWANSEADVTLDVIEDPFGEGWGYHTMWGSPSEWTPSRKTCPGPDRIAQFHRVLAPWLEAGGKDPKPVPTRVAQAHALEREIRGDLRAVARRFAELDALLAEAPAERKAVAKWRAELAGIADEIKTLRLASRDAANQAPQK